MELYVDREELGRGLARVQGIIERRSTQPILAHVLLHAREGKLHLSATDTEVSYLGEIAANTKVSGEIAVDAAQLFQVVRSMPGPTLTLKVGEGYRLEVATGRSAFKLNGVAAEEFPPLATFEAKATARLAERELRRLVEQVSFSVATEDVRWGLNGAHAEERKVGEERRLRLVATDGHRLASAEAPFEGEFRFAPRTLIPRKALAVMRRLLEGDAAQVEIDFGDNALQLRRPGESFWFRLLDGEFPDYRAVVPTDSRHAATLRRSELVQTLRRAIILVAERNRSVKFTFSEDELVVHVQNADRGEVKESLPCELDGGDITVGFNVKYLAEALNALQGERVVLSLAHPLAPCLVRDPDHDDAFFVVMPMRLD
jgi:DNA polymerase-3 subunit beta